MADFSFLEDLFNDVVSSAANSLDESLDAFQSLIGASATQDFGIVNDAVIVVLNAAAEAGAWSASFFTDVFNSWAETFEGSTQAMSEMVAALLHQFAEVPEFLRAALTGLVSTISDFATFFTDLAANTLGDAEAMRRMLETVLLPVFAIGTGVFGTDAGVKAVRAVLSSAAAPLTAMAMPSDLGFELTGLQGWAQNALRSGAYTLPTGTWLIALMIDALRQAGDFASLLPNVPTGNGIFDISLDPIVSALSAMVSSYINEVETLVEMLIAELVSQAEANPELEWQLLKVARFTPVGLFMLAIATSIKLVTNPAPWLSLVFNKIEEDPTLAVKRLPPPTKDQKYIIFSDLHRDEKDAARAKFAFGSFDHFLPNADAYLELLQKYAKEGYTIIEAGDCEELWFHRDVRTLSPATPPAKLTEIIETHREIYDLLRDLHAEGRYYRIFGNHDSYVRDDETFAVLRAAMETDGGPAFEIFDFVILDGVKTMHDMRIDLGLNSAPYADKLPLVITHGHQWDFWNCDSNSILGKLVVSSVVTPLDLIDDPARDLAGVGFSGTPLVNFKQILGDLPVFNSWQSYEPAVVRLDRIQHMEDTDRRMTDDIMYSETLASLMGQFLSVGPAPGMPEPACFLEQSSSMLCLGHTHNPHNMPYYDLGDLPLAKPIVDQVERAIAGVTGGLIDIDLGLVRSYYMNSGICGWYDGCLWGIDLGDQSHGTGQAKLINWTSNTRIDRPNTMDWELPHIPDEPLPGISFKEALDLGVGMFEDAFGPLPVPPASVSLCQVLAEAQRNWVPRDLLIAFGQAKGTLDALMIQIATGMMEGVEGAFTATLELPKALAGELARLMKTRLPCGHRSHQRCLSSAIGVLAVYRGVAQSGLRGRSDDPATAQAVAALMFLAQMVEARRDDLAFSMELKGGSVQARFAFRKEVRAVPEPDPRRRTALPPRLTADRASRRGFEIEACVANTDTPLAGWTVQVERQTGRKTDVLSSVRLDDKGRGRLLGVQVAGGALRMPAGALSKPQLAIYAPRTDAGKRLLISRLPITNAPENGRMKLSVTYAQMRKGGYYAGAAIASVAARQKAVCEGWKERLKRDPNARADLCLQDLVLSTMGALDTPKTAFEKQCAMLIKGRIKDAKDRKAVADHARKTRTALKDCLGDDYALCDGSGSLKDLGARLIKDDARFEDMIKFFGSPSPDPLLIDKIIQPGRGIPFPFKMQFNKDCEERRVAGTLDPDLAAAMQALLQDEPVILSRPSVNEITVWDPTYGQTVRIGDIHDKELTILALMAEEASSPPEWHEHTINMDVFLNDPACLVMMEEPVTQAQPSETPLLAGTTQIMVTDVKPGQRVTLRGSGFVDDRARVRGTFQRWRSELNEGRLVPDDDVLPAGGFSGMEIEVWGAQIAITPNVSPIAYNGDSITFQWPDAASEPGLYRIDLEMKNASELPTSITQNADCTLNIGFEDVTTRAVYFAVLPPPAVASLSVNMGEVECLDLTDVAGFVPIPWPDEILVETQTMHGKFVIPDDVIEDMIPEGIAEFVKSDTFIFNGPGTWQPDEVKMFPEGPGLGPLAELDYLIASFSLSEIDGDFDRNLTRALLVVTMLILLALAVVIAIAVVIAVALWAMAALAIVGAILLVVIEFLFTAAAIGLFVSVIEGLVSTIEGRAQIMSRSVPFVGQDLMLSRSPVRFHRVQVPDADLTQTTGPALPEDVEFANEAYGGSYAVTVEISGEA